MKLNSCDICNGDLFDEIAGKDRHNKPLATVICRRCGLVRHASVPTEQELQQFYADDYREAYNGEKTPGDRRIMRAWKNGERICRQIAPELAPGCRVLEVGAGIGCTVKVFEREGFTAEGVDPGGEFLSLSKEKLRAKVRTASLYDLPRQKRCDVVLLIHVIEHLRSPKTALQHIAGLLKPNGLFYVECPNLQAPFARRSKLFHLAHIHNFAPSTLQMLAESCGFRLTKRFGDCQDSNLQMLFRNTGNAQLRIDTDNYARTMTELRRSDPLPYTLRFRYIGDRFRKIAAYAMEHLTARRFVRQLIAECSQEHSAERAVAGKRAA